MKIFKKIVNWYFSRKALPYWGIFFLDCLAIVCSGGRVVREDLHNA